MNTKKKMLIERLVKFVNALPYIITSFIRKKPDFIIIGAQKAGTTSLFAYLEQHEDLKLAREKEVHYFDLNFWKPNFIYRSYFPLNSFKGLTGEASPYYFFHPLVPKRIKKQNPKVKLIVMLRNPIERAFSQYNMERRVGKENSKLFEVAIKKEDQRLEGEIDKIIQKAPYYNSFSHQAHSYLSRGKYFEQTQHWLKHFSMDQFCFIKSEDFFTNPKGELKRVYDFLAIEEKYPENLKPKNVGDYPKEINEQTIKFCEEYFKEDMIKLETLLGSNFKWF